MIINIITTSPNFFSYIKNEFLIKKAIKNKIVKIKIWNLKTKKKAKILK